MLESEVYNEGTLIVGRMSGVVETQSFINGIFWQIDSCNVGEVKQGFCQLYYDQQVQSVSVTEADIRRIMEINTGIGANVSHFKTALVLQHPEILRLAHIHRELARKHGFQVEIFDSFESAFTWLGMENPAPEKISFDSTNFDNP